MVSDVLERIGYGESMGFGFWFSENRKQVHMIYVTGVLKSIKHNMQKSSGSPVESSR